LSENKNQKVSVIIPVLNEEGSIACVIGDIPRSITNDIVVVDNGCTDSTPERARSSGARVVVEPRRGYGNACLKGLEAVRNADVVVFLDGDYSDYPEEMASLVDKLNEGTP